jgi:tetratricopeptide (TPR) repeat protein
VNQALQLEGGYVRGLVTKAYVLDGLGQRDQAEQLLVSVIKIAGHNDAQAVRLLAEYRSRQIGQMLAAAMALRMPTFSTSTHTEHRYDGVWEITTSYRHDPSASDLRNADDLERKAAALMQETKLIMETAVRTSKGTLEGLLLESSYQNWFGTRDKALMLVQQAVRDYPESIKAHDALIAYLRFLGRQEEVIEQETHAWQLFQTTCAPLLLRVWNTMGKAGWASLEDDLQRARRLNPADARGTAYLAAAKADMEQHKESEALYRVALALEQARLLFDEQGIAQTWPRDTGEMALSMQMHHLLAAKANSAGLKDTALAHYEASATLARRYPVDGVAALMFGAMLPDPKAPAIPVPAPTNGATLAAEGYVGADRALQALGRANEAQRYFEAAASMTRAYGDLTPNIGTGRGDSNFGGMAEGASAEALVELARTDIKNRNYKAAFEKLQAATQAKPSRELRGEINRMTMELLPHLNAR